MKIKSKHPEWVLKHKKPGTELRFIKGRYYLYQVSSKWDKKKKRAQKITGKILGRIIEGRGFVPSGQRISISQQNQLSVKTCGVVSLMSSLMKDVIPVLQKHFGNDAEAIYSSSILRLAYQSPLKNMEFHFEQDFLSESFANVSLSDKNMTALLRNIGKDRERINAFFKEFSKPGDHLLMDMTAIHSKSKEMSINHIGYNSQRNYDPQANLLLLFSQTQHEPTYYRLLPGNIRDVKSVKLSLKESGIKDAVFIADKGFYSETNIIELQESELKYVIPLKRNHSLIDYKPLRKAGKKGFMHFFKFQERFIFAISKEIAKDKMLFTFLDDRLKLEEEQCYLNRIGTHKEDYSIKEFHKQAHVFGTFSIISNLIDKKPEEIYALYKSRMEVEQAFDAFKNTLEADRTYMQNDQSMEGWMFINYIALLAYWRILKLLMQKELLSKFSIKDFLMHLSYIKKIKIDGLWLLAEITEKTKRLLHKLDYSIT